MSAYIVGQKHVAALVNAAVIQRLNVRNEDGQWQQVARENSAAWGQRLFDENRASVNHRYRESLPAPVYDDSQPVTALNPVQVLKLIQGYSYQACEHPGWQEPNNLVVGFLDALKDSTIRTLPGYSDAEWTLGD